MEKLSSTVAVTKAQQNNNSSAVQPPRASQSDSGLRVVPGDQELSSAIKAPVKKPLHVGWVIYRPDTKEFVSSHHHMATTFTKDAALAHCYSTGYLAVRDSAEIHQFTEVVPSFNEGGKIGISLPDDFFGCVCIISTNQPSAH
jgi:hypothetical protein